MKHFIRNTIWTIIIVLTLPSILLKISVVQTFIADNISGIIANKLGTKVEIGTVDLRFPTRILIDKIEIYDKLEKPMLCIGRISATIDIIPLLNGTVSISSAQLFGMNANIYKNDSISPINIQFVIDSLKSKDSTPSTPLDLSIASLIIRNGNITYNQLDKPVFKNCFSPYHISVKKLSSHIILNKLTNDSISINIKRLAFSEQSGIFIKNLTANIDKGNHTTILRNGHVSMHDTDIRIPNMKISYSTEKGQIRKESLHFIGDIKGKKVDLNDLAPIIGQNKPFHIPHIQFSTSIEGSTNEAVATITAHTIDSSDLYIQISSTFKDILNNPKANILFSKLYIGENIYKDIASILKLPEIARNIGTIDAKGRFKCIDNQHYTLNTDIYTSNTGKLSVDGIYNDGKLHANIRTNSLNIASLAKDKQFKDITCDLVLEANIGTKGKITQGTAKGTVSKLAYKNYNYQNINMDIAYEKEYVSGDISINDPNINLTINGKAGIGNKKMLNAQAILHRLRPHSLNLCEQFKGDDFAMSLNANISGSNIDDLTGTIAVTNISVTNPNEKKPNTFLNNFSLSINHSDSEKKVMSLYSDFATIHLHGDFHTSTISKSLTNLIAEHIPAIYSIPSKTLNNNNFQFDINIQDINFIKRLVDIPLNMTRPITARGYVNSSTNSAYITVNAPKLKLFNKNISNTNIQVWTEKQALNANMTTLLIDRNGHVGINFDCRGKDNSLYSTLSWDNMRKNIFRGQLNTITHFKALPDGTSDASVIIPHSSFEVQDTTWNIHSRGINYKNGKLNIDQFAIENAYQHLYINGVVSRTPTDTVTAELKNINIRYILDLINFHSVTFDGIASGKATATSVIQNPTATAYLYIKNFQFENGHLGDMNLHADYNNEIGQININGTTTTPESTLNVEGNISPARNTIDLNMKLQKTPLEFMNSFCGSFMHDITLNGTGDLRLSGPLNKINLQGGIKIDGGTTITSTNCRYTIKNADIKFIPNDILFNNVPLTDKNGNVALLSGGVHHQNLGRISYDLTATTPKFQVYDFPTLGQEDTFCGHAVINGEIGVHGKGNEVNITANCTPVEGSYIIYNASSPEEIRTQDFITWGSATKDDSTKINVAYTDSTKTNEILDTGNKTNIRLNFMVNITPDMRLNLIMDEDTGDDINLYGSGALQIKFYNKGSLDIFGNYTINHGTYQMTVQNLIHREFTFQKGGTIAFAGDPYNASINTQAAYKINSVPLTDLNIGSSFKADNVPVSCLMNLTGTPSEPKIEFGLSLPTLNSDARQMVYSVINSEEEMNQQVLYLLAIGRFYSQENNTNNTQRTKQSTLAMQSVLSGTISQQLNNILNQMLNNTNWSIGANITPGDEGFNNAVYEGLLSGRMFNNRLLFNGQFGYRDNINTNTQNFIGDFTLQYLLTPNGNYAIKMYNQSNDRYFTRSSLNTQGVGFVIQREFGK